jgi:deazaflavin-dependent oxidoreductase (nitroreductase family)
VIPRRLAQFNKRFNNRLQMRWAPYLPPYAVVTHTGRKSATTYRTPVTAVVSHGLVAVPLFYGDDSDWLRNVLAARGAQLTRRGRTCSMHQPRVIPRGRRGELPLAIRVATAPTRNALVADLRY